MENSTAHGPYETAAEVAAEPCVQLGAYDRRVLAWLAGWEPETVQVVAGLISRAGGVR